MFWKRLVKTSPVALLLLVVGPTQGCKVGSTIAKQAAKQTGRLLDNAGGKVGKEVPFRQVPFPGQDVAAGYGTQRPGEEFIRRARDVLGEDSPEFERVQTLMEAEPAERSDNDRIFLTQMANRVASRSATRRLAPLVSDSPEPRMRRMGTKSWEIEYGADDFVAAYERRGAMPELRKITNTGCRFSGTLCISREALSFQLQCGEILVGISTKEGVSVAAEIGNVTLAVPTD